jgi:predicted dehydrogenase
MVGVHLVATCDSRREAAEAAADTFGADYATPDLDRILADDTIEAVVIAVRDDLQAPLAIRSIKAGKHVYVEKPLAGTPEACRAVTTVQQHTGRRLAVGFNKRFAPAYRMAFDVIKADGGPRNLHLQMADDAWRWLRNYPPGHLIKLDACHLFDLVSWLSGSEIVTVFAAESRKDDDAILLKTENGCVATITLSAHGTMDMPKERLYAICQRGGVVVEDYIEVRTHGYPDYPATTVFPYTIPPPAAFLRPTGTGDCSLQNWRQLRRSFWELLESIRSGAIDSEPYADEAKAYAESHIPNFFRNQGWHDALHGFLQGIRNDRPTPHATAHDALLAAEVTDAAVLSRQTGKAIHLHPKREPDAETLRR